MRKTREGFAAAEKARATHPTSSLVGVSSTQQAAPAQYELPAPTWSLSDLNVTTDDEEARETARAGLSPEEVKDGILPGPAHGVV